MSRRNSPRLSSSLSKMTPSRSRNLLKAALTKNLTVSNDTPTFSNETPDTSSNNTAYGIAKAKAHFALNKVIVGPGHFVVLGLVTFLHLGP
jgi:hypothetical protein